MKYPSPKGTFDILPTELKAEDAWRTSEKWLYVEEIMRSTAQNYGFKEIRTPIFEHTELFTRGVGETSDIVSKEMYTFLDKAERSLSLRPEGTAAVMRAFVEKQLYQSGPLHKFYYIAPMFRYERPQAGRYRQHHQFGAEAIGSRAPEQDVEVIDLLCEVYRRLGLKNLCVMINTVGDIASRSAYKAALSAYLTPYLSKLSPESQQRFSKNILRILDSKDPEDKKVMENAPSILEYLNAESKDHFSKVCDLLKHLKQPFSVNPKLVRGLDYYTHTVFEVTSGELGAQNSLGGGGRFDHLIHDCGGPNLPAIGFGSGLERILQTMLKQAVHFPPAPHPVFFLLPLGEAAKTFCFDLLYQLRRRSIPVECDFSEKKISARLQLAVSWGAEYALVLGEEELKAQKVHLKHMATREAIPLPLQGMVEKMMEIMHTK